jgi:hypothetical protein
MYLRPIVALRSKKNMALLNNKAELIGLQECLDALDAAINALGGDIGAQAFVADEVTDWDGGASPATIQAALDQLAARVKVLEP